MDISEAVDGDTGGDSICGECDTRRGFASEGDTGGEVNGDDGGGGVFLLFLVRGASVISNESGTVVSDVGGILVIAQKCIKFKTVQKTRVGDTRGAV